MNKNLEKILPDNASMVDISNIVLDISGGSPTQNSDEAKKFSFSCKRFRDIIGKSY